MIIFFIGMMGSGKSTAGKYVANQLGWQFIDLDDAIADASGKTVAKIFSEEGETAFRLKEAAALLSIVADAERNMIVSAGGGTPCFHDNMAVMKQNGIVIWLDQPAGKIFNRLQHAKQQRPLLQVDDPLKEIQRLMEEREPFYSMADHRLAGDETEKKSVLDFIKSSVIRSNKD